MPTTVSINAPIVISGVPLRRSIARRSRNVDADELVELPPPWIFPLY